MSDLANLSYKYRKFIVIAWLVLLAGIVGISNQVGSAYSDSLTLPKAESKIALDLMAQYSPTQKGESIQVVYSSKNDPLNSAQIEPVERALASLPHVSDVESAFSKGGIAVSEDGKIAFSTVHLDVNGRDVKKNEIEKFISTAKSFSRSDLQIELLGDSIANMSEARPSESTRLALLIAAIILFITFGSVIAAIIPLLVAVIALGVSSSVVSLLSHVFLTAEFAPILSALVGLGVGIDYALFIVTRFRAGLHSGLSVETAVKTSIKTSGRAVLFAGIIVCFALLGLLTVGVSFLYGVAIAAAISVLITMSASLTLLPALLSIIGHGVDRFSIPGRSKDSHDIEKGGWAKWSRAIQRRPVIWSTSAALLLIVLSIPAFSIRLGTADSGNDAKGTTTRAAYDLLAKGFGAGYSGPLTLVASIPNGADTTILTELELAIATDKNVARVIPTYITPDSSLGVITVYSKSSPQSEETTQLIERLRQNIIPEGVKDSAIKIYVGGSVAIFVDFGNELTKKLPLFVSVVVLLSFFLLMILFRSLLIPLKAAVMNIFSIGAAFGVVVAAFQWGWAEPLLGTRGGPIEPFLPIMLFAILFGLSMDYEVFLVSRIQEEWLLTKDNSVAVRRGLAATGGVITAAATIMFAVFTAFIFGGQRTIQEFGVGLSSAVLFDATIIRSALVPALMQWWGKANWWLPGWLDKLLPKFSVESSQDLQNSELE
jgi:RND superfamily putative drug exporter